ncbi:hypothetical protein BV20DRAFT_86967 [Pilatotrama ljubarskyi]|nr:hypothetical protein BV20DRAFT_86967 [Pilatotrama ljubarskyi]
MLSVLVNYQPLRLRRPLFTCERDGCSCRAPWFQPSAAHAGDYTLPVRRLALFDYTVGCTGPRHHFQPPQTLTQCMPVNISWNDIGLDPYSLAIISGQAPFLIERWDNIDNTWITWDTNVTAGSSISFVLTDMFGDSTVSNHITVRDSGNSSCLSSSSSSASTSSTSDTDSAPISALPVSASSADFSSVTSTYTASSPSGTSQLSTTGFTNATDQPQAKPSVNVKTTSSTPHDLSAGALAGIVVSSGLSALALLLLLLWGRKRSMRPCSRYMSNVPPRNHSSLTPVEPRMSGKSTLLARSGTPATSASASTSVGGLHASSNYSRPLSPGAAAASTASLHHVPMTSPSGTTSSCKGEAITASTGRTDTPSPDLRLASSCWHPSPLSQSFSAGTDSIRMSGESSMQGLMSVDVESGIAQEVDGGVRLAGGPVEDLPATVPPPYRVY